jgi:hypothetical protein
MKPATLAIQYLPYPHTANNIVELLNQIIYKWKFDGKFLTITINGRYYKIALYSTYIAIGGG